MVDVSSEDFPQTARGTGVLRSVFQTLAYADVFDYPLTVNEVYRYLPEAEASFEAVSQALNNPILFSNTNGYYSLHGREEIVETRQRRAEIAGRLWRKAGRYGWIIASLPFVRMVAVTGSLSMNNTDDRTDVDYMIVTAPNHLWTCRALILLVARFAKIEGVRLCPNYLVTTHALELQEHSMYVAHELAQMRPLSGMETYQEMRRLNDWMSDYLPHALMAPESPAGVRVIEKSAGIQKPLEMVFRLPVFAWFERWEMKRKIKRLSREQSESLESYFSADVCKGHMDKHGQNVVTALAVRLQEATEVATTDTV